MILFQIVAPEEVSFDLRGDGQFVDLEGTIPSLQVDFGRIRKAYQANFQRHMLKLSEEVGKVGCDRVVITTDQPLSDVLSTYLLRRQSIHGKAN